MVPYISTTEDQITAVLEDIGKQSNTVSWPVGFESSETLLCGFQILSFMALCTYNFDLFCIGMTPDFVSAISEQNMKHHKSRKIKSKQN